MIFGAVFGPPGAGFAGAQLAAGSASPAFASPASLAVLLTLSVVSALPFVFMGATAFVKISTVLHIVRSAIGLSAVPSNTVITALSTALALTAMAPVGERIFEGAVPLFAHASQAVPETDRSATPRGSAAVDAPPQPLELVRRGVTVVREPLRDFFKANASEQERKRFVDVARRARPEAERERISQDDLAVLVPAFVVTELREAFALGFVLFLPFLVIDLVVANVLLALGMSALSPTQVSIPFKLLLFVAMNGWGLLAQALVAGYR
jgi:type III secretion protein R